MDIKGTIAELDRIDGLVRRLYEISNTLDDMEAKQDSEVKSLFSEYYPSLPKMPQAFGALAQEPGVFCPEYTGRVKISSIAFAASLALLLMSKLFGVNGFALGILAFFATVGFGIWFYSSYQKYIKEKKDYEDAVNRRAKFVELLEGVHPQEKAQFETDLEDFNTQYQLCLNKTEEYYAAYNERRSSLLTEGKAVSDDIEAVTLLSQDYVHLAGRVRDMLTSGRADTLKEALNLSIAEKRDEDFKAKQHAEAVRQTAVLEQQALETRLHNERMEQEAAEQTRYAQSQSQLAEVQLKATQKQSEQLQKLLDQKR